MYKKKSKHIHFVGIGGVGMSGIAEVLLNLGYRVSGSDLRESATTRRLEAKGGEISLGHRAEAVEGAGVVVTSTAIKADNPEVLAAYERHIPVIARAEMLAELMRLKKFGIAIAGSHGKTSTTSMVGCLLAHAGLDPTVIIGGMVNAFGTNAKLGEGEFLVAEADESDGSFLRLAPVVEVITNIDLEHLDYYSDLNEIKETFLQFISKIPFYGAAIICIDDPNIAEIFQYIDKRVITYGLTAQAEIHAREIETDGLKSSFDVYREGELLGRLTITQPGLHYVYNSLATVCVGLELDIPFQVIGEALAAFSGVQRRVEVKGEKQGVTVVDDYGHHPTEVKATLSALRDAWPNRRLIVLFQPHRYSRTKGLFKEFCTAFHEADILVMTDIYAAGEESIEGITAEALLQATKQHGQRQTCYVARLENLATEVVPLLRQGDVLLTLGAGDIYQVGEQILEQLDHVRL
ncbi:MAG: UDP-N-acetylmuramate--L-alanine ligase [Desulfurivibrionaceae bacterium]|nr:UDP-N-acetylmuramate--L-alanine ligase [Desulfobulbales bacterium]MDT8334510.1 UDP-N-acetylmuramate--L-alanine ligase [Desulfurivibrionaceae bacterium]